MKRSIQFVTILLATFLLSAGSAFAQFNQDIQHLRPYGMEGLNQFEGFNINDDMWMAIKTRGILEIAGVQDTTTVNVQGKLVGEDRFRVKGSKQISMGTYAIKPPSHFFGLIKASSELTVHFDVTVRLNDDKTLSPLRSN